MENFIFHFGQLKKSTFSSYTSEIKYTLFKFPALQSFFLFTNCSWTGYDLLIYSLSTHFIDQITWTNFSQEYIS